MHIESRRTWLVIAALALGVCQGCSQQGAVAEAATNTTVEAEAIMALDGPPKLATALGKPGPSGVERLMIKPLVVTEAAKTPGSNGGSVSVLTKPKGPPAAPVGGGVLRTNATRQKVPLQGGSDPPAKKATDNNNNNNNTTTTTTSNHNKHINHNRNHHHHHQHNNNNNNDNYVSPAVGAEALEGGVVFTAGHLSDLCSYGLSVSGPMYVWMVQQGCMGVWG